MDGKFLIIHAPVIMLLVLGYFQIVMLLKQQDVILIFYRMVLNSEMAMEPQTKTATVTSTWPSQRTRLAATV